MKYAALAAASLLLSGCAGLAFDAKDGKGVVYYDPAPFLSVTCDEKGNYSVGVIVLPNPAVRHTVRPGTGWGSSTQSVTFQNGMITTFNQETDPQTLETLKTLAGFAGLGTSDLTPNENQCFPKLYPITSTNGTLGIGAVTELK